VSAVQFRPQPPLQNHRKLRHIFIILDRKICPIFAPSEFARTRKVLTFGFGTRFVFAKEAAKLYSLEVANLLAGDGQRP